MDKQKLLCVENAAGEPVTDVAGGEYKVASHAEQMFFQGTEGLVHAFDFDYDTIQAYQLELGYNNMLCASVMLPPCAPVCFGCWHLCGRQNIIDDIRAKHICVTEDGIRFIHDRHKKGLRLQCDEAGKVTRTIPFDKLTDCDIEEPAGAVGPLCCMVPRVLHTVNIDTASSGQMMGPEGRPMVKHELQVVGLHDPHGFKSLVWRMKRTQLAQNGGAGISSGVKTGMSREQAADMVPLLKEQNKLLARQVELLEQISASSRSADGQ